MLDKPWENQEHNLQPSRSNTKALVSSVIFGDTELKVRLWDSNSITNWEIVLTPETVSQLGWNIEISAKIFYANSIAYSIYSDNHKSKIILNNLLTKEPKIIQTLLSVNNPSENSIYLQFYLLAFTNPLTISLPVQKILSEEITIGWQNFSVLEFLQNIYSGLEKQDILKDYLKNLSWWKSWEYRKNINLAFDLLNKFGTT
jgi:hypothetical protein